MKVNGITGQLSLKERATAALCYTGPLCLGVWSMQGERSSFVEGHLREGLILLCGEAGIYLLSAFPGIPQNIIIALAWMACSFSLLGFLKALAGSGWKLPLFLGRLSGMIEL